MPAVIIIHRHNQRRTSAARRLAELGQAPGTIGPLLGLSARQVEGALAGRAVHGQIWTDDERAALAREMGSIV